MPGEKTVKGLKSELIFQSTVISLGTCECGGSTACLLLADRKQVVSSLREEVVPHF